MGGLFDMSVAFLEFPPHTRDMGGSIWSRDQAPGGEKIRNFFSNLFHFFCWISLLRCLISARKQLLLTKNNNEVKKLSKQNWLPKSSFTQIFFSPEKLKREFDLIYRSSEIYLKARYRMEDNRYI